MAQRSTTLIKSAVRALQVLELFDGSRQSVTVMDVARGLDYPQSSTSNLLKCLVSEGYLTLDAAARHYSPSARLALMGSWAKPRLFRHGTMLRLLDDLAEQALHTAILASRSGLALRHIQVVGDDTPSCLATGTVHQVTSSALGHILLSTLGDGEIRKLVHRLNAEKQPETPWLPASDLLATLESVRVRGFATSKEGDHSIIAVLLPEAEGEQLALGVAVRGTPGAVCTDRLVRELRQAVASHISPMAPASYAHVPSRASEYRQAVS